MVTGARVSAAAAAGAAAAGAAVYLTTKLWVETALDREQPKITKKAGGMISGGRAFPAQSVQFSDIKIAVLLNALLDRRKAADEYHSRELAELARSLESREVKALSRMYSAGKPITQK